MRQIVLLSIYTILFGLFLNHAYGQQIIVSPNPTGRCLGMPASITMTTTGAFAADNTFVLQIADADYYPAAPRSIPFTRAGDVLNFQIPNTFQVGNGKNYKLRVVSTNPVIESAWSNTMQVFAPSSITLVSASPETLNPYQITGLTFRMNGSQPITAILSDSTTYTFSDPYYYSEFYAQTKPYTVTATGTNNISLIRAINQCGSGTVAGSVRIEVNPVVIKLRSVFPSIVCRGDTLQVTYSKGSGSFDQGNTFRIKLVSDVYTPTSAQVYELPAIESDGVLKAYIPDSLKDNQWGYNVFKVSVASTRPYVETSDYITVELRPRATAEIVSTGQTLTYGDSYSPVVRFKGRGPYRATLSNGAIIEAGDYASITGNATSYPAQQTLYKIDKFSSGCSSNQITPSSALVLVNPGLWIDSIPSLNTFLCEGQTARIRIASNLPFTRDTRISVTLRRTSGSFVSDPIPARLEPGNWISFDIPALQANAGSESRQYYIKVSTVNPDLSTIERSYWSDPTITINRSPEFIRFTNDQPEVYANPQQVFMTFQVSGGGYYSMTVKDDLRQSTLSPIAYPYLNQLVSRTTTFTIVSVTNSCGTLYPENVSKTIVIQNPAPNRILLKPVTDYVCYTDSLTLNFIPEGTFLPGNEFRLQAAMDHLGTGYGWVDAAIYGRSQTSSIRFKLPGSMKVRVLSTNPVTISEEMPVALAPALKARLGPFSETDMLTPDGLPAKTVIAGEKFTLPIEVNTPTETGPYSVTYTDGRKQYSFTATGWWAHQQNLSVTQTSTFSLVDVRNPCGRASMEGSATITVVPFRIKPVLPSGYNLVFSYCNNDRVTFPFVTDREPASGTIFTLQIASKSDSVFKDIASGMSSPLSGKLPENLLEGDYWLRIVVRNTAVSTRWFDAKVNRVAKATLFPPASGTLVNPGEYFRPLIVLNGSFPMEMQFSDNMTGTYVSSPVQQAFYPTKGSSFFIRYLSNVCGFGTSTGEFKIAVRPTLSVYRLDNNIMCTGNKMLLSFAAQGDFEPSAILTFDLTDDSGLFIKTIGRPTSYTGTFQYTIPPDLPAGNYRIYLRSTAPAISSASYIVFKNLPVPEISLSGSTTVNYGQTTSIQLRNTGSPLVGEYISLIFSNGMTANIYLNGNNPAALDVTPLQTTTYSLMSAKGACGFSSFTGSATVVVNPPQAKAVSTGNTPYIWLCPANTITVPFTTVGTFSSGNQFTGQLIDSTGAVVYSFPTTTTRSPLTVTIPEDLPAGWGYRTRVMATDENTASSASPAAFRIQARGTASFQVSAITKPDGKPLILPVRLGGDGPWNYTITSGTQLFTGSSQTSPTGYITSTTAVQFTLVSVSTQCGYGFVQPPAVIRVYNGMSTIKDGEWTDPLIWSSNRIPTSSDSVIIRHRVSIPADSSGTVRQLIYDYGGRLQMGINAGLRPD